MTNTTKRLVLVDGSSYLYRAFHAMPSLTNSEGFPTGAIYGVINMLRRLLTTYPNDQMIVIFDAKGKTFRHELYEHYKAHRPAMPAELAQQIASIHAIIRALGIPILMEEGVEADDVIGTLAKQAEQQNLEIIISTGDKDLAQLVTKKTTLINTMTNTVFDIQTVKEKFGIPPELMIDYLTLIGDPVDNIPGIPQVGPKTAVKWLTEHGSLEKIIAHSDKITGKVGESLRACLAQLPLSKNLATIKLDVKLTHDYHTLTRQPISHEELIKLYQTLEFKTWLSELLEKQTKPKEDKYTHYEMILTDAALQRWLTLLTNQPLFALDTETTSIHYINAELVGLSFAIAPGKAAYLPLSHDYEGAPQQLNREDVLQKLKPVLENSAIKKVGHHIKYDMEVLANHGIKLQGIAFDTLLESYILDSAGNNHGLNALALKYLNWRMIHFEDIAGKGAKQLTFNKVSVEEALKYAAEDADVTWQLHHLLWPKIEKEAGLKYIFLNIEIPLIAPIARMERNGVLINPVLLQQQSVEITQRLFILEQTAFDMVGHPFNLNSPKQLQDILFNQLKLPILQKTPTGQPSTADAVLQELALDYALPKQIIEYRALNKLMTTYTNRLPLQINTRTNRIHTSYNQTGAATGRLSSSDPNLQNIPIRTAEGRRIREAFIAPPGYQLISADYSQIELRIMAHLSNDANLLKAFAQNLDIHTATAAEVLGIPLEKVNSEERRRAKAINFGLIYGMSAFGLVKQLGITRQEAQDYIDRYFERYPGVKIYMEETRAKAHLQGFVETLWGRRLYLPDINSSQIPRQKAAERTAINAPLQGTAADIIKRAMISLDGWLQTNKVNAKLIMQVHDELVLEVEESIIPQLTEAVRTHMMNAAELKVPLLVSIGAGNNWNAAADDD